LEHDLQELLRTSLLLINEVGDWNQHFHDYSFVVFPASKAYEGFLKKLFLDLGFIDEEAYHGRRFRIGKALNPSLDRRRYKGESVYDKIVDYCGGKALADTLWDTWKNCRNILFHWLPDEKKVVSFEEAGEKVEQVLNAIEAAFTECEVKETA